MTTAPSTGPTAADDELAARAMAATRDPVLHAVAVALDSPRVIGHRIIRIVRPARRRRDQ